MLAQVFSFRANVVPSLTFTSFLTTPAETFEINAIERDTLAVMVWMSSYQAQASVKGESLIFENSLEDRI